MKIVALNWRDLTHPDGGGSEKYIEEISAGLADRGHDVTLFCPDHGRSPRDETKNGVRYVRRGNRFSVYPTALAMLLSGKLGNPDVVIDVSNGIPFFSPLVRRLPVVGIVHHVHREQWGVVMGPLGAKVGWFLESQVAPRIYQSRPMVAVSQTTRAEMLQLGFRATTKVVHNGTEVPAGSLERQLNDEPTLCVLGRLVPHKRVDHALEAVAALQEEFPGLKLWIIGTGWGQEELVARAAELSVSDRVTFTGFVSQEEKHDRLSRCWVHLCPSVKEGWGLSVMEAAWHGAPTVAYNNAGGLSESIVDGASGLLVEPDLEKLIAATRELLADDQLRERLSDGARQHARQFTWQKTVERFENVLHEAIKAHRASL